jgi:DNA-binding CsgD family transcriptional regulator
VNLDRADSSRVPHHDPDRDNPDASNAPGSTESNATSDGWWRPIVAVGAVAGDLSARAVARYSTVSIDQAAAALDAARDAGVLHHDRLDPAEASGLVADLSPGHVADIHAAVARRLMAEGPSRLLDAIEHARAAGNLVPMDELVGLTEHAGSTSLSIGDYDAARQLLEVADEFGFADPPAIRAKRLCHLADALDGLGQITEARSVAARAFDLAELAADPALATEAAVRHALPADWYAGDSRAASLLQRAAALNPGPDDTIAITAARAIVEMRIPVSGSLDQQLAWVTRASVAQPLAEQAIHDCVSSPLPVQALAALAWRTTHRSPWHLNRRREVSSRAMDLTQQLRLPGRQVDAAVMMAVDAMESADRPGYDEALSVARWVAERDGNPRLVWHALTMAAGAAHLDGDVDLAATLRVRARAVGEPAQISGWLGADLLLFGEEVLARRDPAEVAAAIAGLDDDNPTLVAPIGRLMVAHGHGLAGDADAAERNLRRALRGLDEESSYLLVATRSAQIAVMLGLSDVAHHLITVLTPWADHVAVDSNAWWCDGPVALALAELHLATGSPGRARQLLAPAEAVALTMGDVRAMSRAATLRDAIGEHGVPTGSDIALTDREWQVLTLVARGRTNPEIALSLAYSASTIRNDLTAVYKKLNVRGRSEAAARAHELGIK